MSMHTFDWTREINQVVTKSLVTTFGLDFLLLEDKKGGDVDTVQNVRKGIWATEEEKQNYENRGKYDKDANHQHSNYLNTGALHKKLQKNGQLTDAYRKYVTIKTNEIRNLDHVIAASEIHNDAARVLARLDGVELANQSSNFCVTGETINKVKNAHSIDKFLGQYLQQSIADREKNIIKLKNKLNEMPQNTPQQQHEYRQVQGTIETAQKRLDQLKQVDSDEMKKVDKEAREKYNQQINNAYYTSTRFFKNSFVEAKNKSLQMGLRESLGLIFAEIWFELKEVIPILFEKYKNIEFTISNFLNDLEDILINIVDRVKIRFKDILETFQNSALSGFFSSITTTIMNIFLTTAKLWGKIIRETWLNIINIAKLVFFNPEKLSTGQLTKEAFKILSASVGLLIGVIMNESLVYLKALPLGDAITTFISALASGIVILGLNYFIEQSQTMKKVWAFLDQIKNKYEKVLDHFKEINTELDRYILELTQLEFGIDVNELGVFARELSLTIDELERNIILKQEVEKQSIQLPFEMGNVESSQNWLLGLVIK
ncbi:DNA repair protein [Acinetobacter bereziniae]|uniref:DNA repair protein n=1 Tax=Acinetobacter bereziniae TaxID=106648 RepID=UPI000EF65A50|nr:DNA repair protein [Acinetobacter bereziniae]MBJ8423084.1 DNA repair protein [Acinetobacter bereziniae]MBJ8450522.1 DNA repair protein [Acinetobacter bereziniae]MBJ8455536.1 DNA repair protein [Acinetobacter bereziniae]MCU4473987.1 DNA repair protein [Acinetobacter bereziniae]MCU4540517.1 DNA repair protein [Acinetobacter bereziniae]